MRARPLECVSCPPSQRMPIGAHKLSLHTRKRKTHTNSRTVQHAVGVCKYKCVDGLGTANGVPYGTLYFMAACPKIGASALPAVPAVTKQEGGTRACVIATGLWVPLRFHSVAPKIPSVFWPVVLCVPGCALEFVPKRLGKWASLELAGNYSSQGCRSLLVICGMPRLSYLESVCLPACLSARLSVYVEEVRKG